MNSDDGGDQLRLSYAELPIAMVSNTAGLCIHPINLRT